MASSLKSPKALISAVYSGVWWRLTGLFGVLEGLFKVLEGLFKVLEGLFKVLEGLFGVLEGLFGVLAALGGGPWRALTALFGARGVFGVPWRSFGEAVARLVWSLDGARVTWSSREGFCESAISGPGVV